MPQKGPQMCAIWPKYRWKPRQMSPAARLCVSRMAPQNLVRPRKSARSVCYGPRKWHEATVFRKACATASPDLKNWHEWCATSRSLLAHPGYMKFMEMERNFLGLKTGSSRLLQGTKCPRKVRRRGHMAQKSVETSSNVPYCKAVRIRDSAPKFGPARKISLERVLWPMKMA
jgi:hypothetical protein